MSKTETMPPTTSTIQEEKLATECEREYCYDKTPYPVEISVGDVEQTWCPQCVADEFGLEYHEYKQRQQSIFRHVTPATVGAFTLGAVLMLLIASIMVV